MGPQRDLPGAFSCSGGCKLSGRPRAPCTHTEKRPQSGPSLWAALGAGQPRAVRLPPDLGPEARARRGPARPGKQLKRDPTHSWDLLCLQPSSSWALPSLIWVQNPLLRGVLDGHCPRPAPLCLLPHGAVPVGCPVGLSLRGFPEETGTWRHSESWYLSKPKARAALHHPGCPSPYNSCSWPGTCGSIAAQGCLLSHLLLHLQPLCACRGATGRAAHPLPATQHPGWRPEWEQVSWG